MQFLAVSDFRFGHRVSLGKLVLGPLSALFSSAVIPLFPTPESYKMREPLCKFSPYRKLWQATKLPVAVLGTGSMTTSENSIRVSVL
jgi:hypothetical protein